MPLKTKLRFKKMSDLRIQCTGCGKMDIFGDDLKNTQLGCLCTDCRTENGWEAEDAHIVLLADMSVFAEKEMVS